MVVPVVVVLTVVINSRLDSRFSPEALKVSEVTAFESLLRDFTQSANVAACRRKCLKSVLTGIYTHYLNLYLS